MAGDALYLDPRLCKLILKHNKDFIAVLKNENRDLIYHHDANARKTAHRLHDQPQKCPQNSNANLLPSEKPPSSLANGLIRPDLRNRWVAGGPSTGPVLDCEDAARWAQESAKRTVE